MHLFWLRSLDRLPCVAAGPPSTQVEQEQLGEAHQGALGNGYPS
jgi:hypothetical protein